MSFGGSVGDIFTVGQFAWNVYKACKGASSEFEEISREVSTLHTAIKELQDEVENEDSLLNRAGSTKKKEVENLVRHCRTVLKQLQRLVTRYKSLGTNQKRTWDRIKFGTEGVQDIREKLTFHTSAIQLFLTTLGTGSLGRIEKKLETIIDEIRSGKRESSLLTTSGDGDAEAEVQWDALKSELVEDGFTKQDIESHKHSIVAHLQQLIDDGELQESVPQTKQYNRNSTSSTKGQGTTTQYSNYKAPKVEEDNIGSDLEDDNFSSGSEASTVSIQSTIAYDNNATPTPAINTPHQASNKVSGDDAPKFWPPERKTGSSSPPETESSPRQNKGLETKGRDSDSMNLSSSKLKDPINGSRAHIRQKSLSPQPPPMSHNNESRKAWSLDSVEPHRPELKDPINESRARIGPKPLSPVAYPYTERMVSPPSPPPLSPLSDSEESDDESDFESNKAYYNRSFDQSRGDDRFRWRSPRRNHAIPPQPSTSPWGRISSSHRPLDPYSEEGPRNAHYDVRYPFFPSTATKHGIAEAFLAGSPRSQIRQVPHGGPRKADFMDPETIFTESFRGGPNGLNHDGSPTSSSRTGYPYRDIEPHAPLPEAKIVERPLPLALEEFFTGTRKKLKIRRRLSDKPGEYATEEKIAEMDIKPGLTPGTKFKFRGAGDLDQGQFQDVHFIVTEKPHPDFTRNKHDINATVELSLGEALTGWSRTIGTIDGKHVPMSGAGPTAPGFQVTFPGLGMPKRKCPIQRGDFVVTIHVKFPSSLSTDGRQLIKQLFDSLRQTGDI